MKWTEISDQPESKRFQALGEELKLSEVENEFIITQVPKEFLDPDFIRDESACDQFRIFVKDMKSQFDQIQIGGFFRENIDLFSHEYPAELKQIKVFDSIVKTDGRWWPRNQLVHSFIKLMNREIKNIDLTAPILMIGTNPDSRSMISALIKIGFNSFNITDVNPEASHILVEELKRSYFSTQFEMTEIGFVTQLPNIYSMGINSLTGELDETAKMALIYFNFLPKGGFWIESCPKKDSPLVTEALSFGFHVKLGVEIVSSWDFTWAKAVTNTEINLPRYLASLEKIYND